MEWSLGRRFNGWEARLTTQPTCSHRISSSALLNRDNNSNFNMPIRCSSHIPDARNRHWSLIPPDSSLKNNCPSQVLNNQRKFIGIYNLTESGLGFGYCVSALPRYCAAFLQFVPFGLAGSALTPLQTKYFLGPHLSTSPIARTIYLHSNLAQLNIRQVESYIKRISDIFGPLSLRIPKIGLPICKLPSFLHFFIAFLVILWLVLQLLSDLCFVCMSASLAP
jgi:hypothetical protein